MPLEVKLALEQEQREKELRAKELLSKRKRRWCDQLRSKAKRKYSEVCSELRRLYPKDVFKDLKADLDSWLAKALDDAKKMKWQRSTEAAEARCKLIDGFIDEGYSAFQSLTHQKAVQAITQPTQPPAGEEAPKAAATSASPPSSPSVGICDFPPQPVIPQPPASEDQNTAYVTLTFSLPAEDILLAIPRGIYDWMCGAPGGMWTWLTEEQDRTYSGGSDIFRAIGSNLLGRGALDLLLGIYVKDDGRVTTTRLDTILNATLVAGPILRGVSAGAKLVGWTSKTSRGLFSAAVHLNLSGKALDAAKHVDDLVLAVQRTSDSLKAAAYSAKTYLSELELLSSLKISDKLDNLIRVSDDVAAAAGIKGASLSSLLRKAEEKLLKAEDLLSTLSKPYGLDQILGGLRKNNSAAGYLSRLGEAKGLDFLYGGFNASYTRTGIAGFVKASIGRPFDALAEAAKIVKAKTPKQVRNQIDDIFSSLGWTDAYSQQVEGVLKGFDDAATVRTAAFGNEAVAATQALASDVETAYYDLQADVEARITELEELLSQLPDGGGQQ